MTDPSRALVVRLLHERNLVRLLGFALIILVIFSFASPSFLTVISFQSMGYQLAEVGLLSIAMMLTMLTGGIDLSIVSIANLSALVAAQLFKATNAGDAVGGKALGMSAVFIVLAMLTGLACGLLNGLLITRVGITPILATLGTMQLINGVAIVWTGGQAIYGMPEAFLAIGTGKLAGVPIPVIILAAAAAVAAVMVNRTGIGMRLKLVGANPTAARYSALDNDRALIFTYLSSALLASVAGIVMSARSASANADYGTSYVLLAVVICVLGGVNPMGGYGTIGGVVLAVITLQMVSTGFNAVGFTQFVYLVAQGVILIGVLALNQLSDRFRGRYRVGWRLRHAGAEAVQTPEALGPAVPAPEDDAPKRQPAPPRA